MNNNEDVSNNEESVLMSYVKLMSFLGVLALVVLWVIIILQAFFTSFGVSNPQGMSSQAITERLRAIEVVAVVGEQKPVVEAIPVAASEASPVEMADIDASAIVKTTCAACHSIGLLNSPKTGDKKAWDERLQANNGLDGIVKSAIAGKGAMPARGGNANLTDAEIKAAIEFMME
jgi:cytochrome c5